MTDRPSIDDAPEREARRAFLIRCGRFAAVTPPAMTTLLAVSSVPREAHASTIGRRPERPIIRFIFGLLD